MAENEKAENRKKLMDLEHDIQLNKPKSVLDGYNHWMSRGGDCDESYAIRVDKEVFRQVDDSYFAINETDIIELLTNQELECGILTLFEMSFYHLKGRSVLNKPSLCALHYLRQTWNVIYFEFLYGFKQE